MKVKPEWNCITSHGVWTLMKVALRQVLTKGVLHQKTAHELINQPDFTMTKCISRRTHWDRIAEKVQQNICLEMVFIIHIDHILCPQYYITCRGRMGPGIWGYRRVIRRYKWSGTRGNYRLLQTENIASRPRGGCWLSLCCAIYAFAVQG